MADRPLRGIFLGILASVAPLVQGACSSSDPAPGLLPAAAAATPDAGEDDPCSPTPVTVGCRSRYCVALAPDADIVPDDQGRLPQDQCLTLCADTGVLSCDVVAPAEDGGDPRLRCQPNCTGRAPDGLADCPQGAGLGGYFGEMARLEAASVVAFRRLAHELREHGAPQPLRRAARRAARDEVRHARLAQALAERFGGRYRAPVVAPSRPRSLLDLARENAAEGVVREAFGALAAGFQAAHAADGAIRSTMRRIARDETRHAELSLAIERWATPSLAPEAQRAVAAARAEAISTLSRELERDPERDLAVIAGAPSRHVARALAAELARQLWS
jgi:hypothetical protein